MVPEHPDYCDADRRHLRVVDAHPELFAGDEPADVPPPPVTLTPSPGSGRPQTRDVPDPDVTGAPIAWAFVMLVIAAALVGWWRL